MRYGLIAALAVIAGGGTGLAYAMLTRPKATAVEVKIDPPVVNRVTPTKADLPTNLRHMTYTPPLICNGKPSPQPLSADGRLFGHYRYDEPPAADLVSPPAAFRGPNCQLIQRDMAASLNALIAAAIKDDPAMGKSMIGVSCYRSIERQRGLFCNPAKLAARGVAGQAKWIAPPGFSEHATGFVVDFGARTIPQCHANPCFKTTRTGQWLAANARKFGFELSFREGNAQGVSYESWHYRWVESAKAKEVFAPARAAFPAG